MYVQSKEEKIRIAQHLKATRSLSSEEEFMLAALLDDEKFVFYEDGRVNLAVNIVCNN